MSSPTSSMLSSAGARRRCCGPCLSTSRSWPASSKATVHDGGRVDLTTGEVWPQAAIEYALETGEEDEDTADDPERWLLVHGEGSREAYRDMELFIASVEPDRAERLATAIKGRGAFRRFKDELARWPGELERWYALSEERRLGRARSWLTAAGYRVLPAARRDP